MRLQRESALQVQLFRATPAFCVQLAVAPPYSPTSHLAGPARDGKRRKALSGAQAHIRVLHERPFFDLWEFSGDRNSHSDAT